VEARRIFCAGVVLGATLFGAVWLYSYRVWNVVEFIGLDGRPFHDPERVKVQPWWGPFGAVALAGAGATLTVWLLPSRRRIIRRVVKYFAARA
jgi:hypothetical protein